MRVCTYVCVCVCLCVRTCVRMCVSVRGRPRNWIMEKVGEGLLPQRKWAYPDDLYEPKVKEKEQRIQMKKVFRINYDKRMVRIVSQVNEENTYVPIVIYVVLSLLHIEFFFPSKSVVRVFR